MYAHVCTHFAFKFCTNLFTSSFHLRSSPNISPSNSVQPCSHYLSKYVQVFTTFAFKFYKILIHNIIPSTRNTPQISNTITLRQISHRPSTSDHVSTHFAFKFYTTLLESSFHLRQSLNKIRLQFL